MVDLRVAAVVPCTSAEGPFERFAVWLQGCTLDCPGCCNPEMFDPCGGTGCTLEQLLGRLDAARAEHNIEGITVLGGEPLQQLEAVQAFAKATRARGLGVLLFTGYTLQSAQALPGFAALWDSCDTLVDGRFDPRRREATGGRRFIGSTNQQLCHNSDRYQDPALWQGANRVEVTIESSGALRIHGFPKPVEQLRRALTKSR